MRERKDGKKIMYENEKKRTERRGKQTETKKIRKMDEEGQKQPREMNNGEKRGDRKKKCVIGPDLNL